MPDALNLRIAAPADAEAVAAIYAPYVRDTVISFELEPPDAGEMRRRIESIVARYPWLLARAGGDILGYAYACEHRSRAAYRWDVDVAVYLRQDALRRGVGRRLYAALFELLARQNYVNAYAGITLPNAASVGLHEAMGFVRLGIYRKVGYKHGAWHDVGWWSLLLTAPPPPAPAEPVPIAQVQAQAIQTILERSGGGTASPLPPEATASTS